MLSVGDKVTVKVGGKLRTGNVLELGDSQFCIEFTDGDHATRWISNSAVVTGKATTKVKAATKSAGKAGRKAPAKRATASKAKASVDMANDDDGMAGW